MNIRVLARLCRSGRAIVATIAGLAALCCAVPTAANASCQNGYTLYGSYGLLVAGNSLSGGTTKFLSGVLNSSGNCTLSGTLTGGLNGAQVTSAATGTYTYNNDGTLTVTLTLAGDPVTQTYAIGLGTFPTEGTGIETDGTAQASIDLLAQNWPFQNNNRTLNGVFATTCIGTYASDLNYVSFDGNGHLSGVDVFNNGGNQGNSPYTGNYNVNPDGSFTGTLNGNFSQFTFFGVIDNFTRQISYVYNQAGFGTLVSCIGKKH